MQTISIVMVGQLPFPPYQPFTGPSMEKPDNTGADSGYGANYLLNVGLICISSRWIRCRSITLAVGGDLTETFKPYVSGPEKPFQTTTPTGGQFFGFSATQNKWLPTTVSFQKLLWRRSFRYFTESTVVGLRGIGITTWYQLQIKY